MNFTVPFFWKHRKVNLKYRRNQKSISNIAWVNVGPLYVDLTHPFIRLPKRPKRSTNNKFVQSISFSILEPYYSNTMSLSMVSIDFCYCKDTPTIERDTMPPDIAALFALCPRGQMSRCLCHDNTVVHFPFDLSTLFSICRPKRVID